MYVLKYHFDEKVLITNIWRPPENSYYIIKLEIEF